MVPLSLVPPPSPPSPFGTAHYAAMLIAGSVRVRPVHTEVYYEEAMPCVRRPANEVRSLFWGACLLLLLLLLVPVRWPLA